MMHARSLFVLASFGFVLSSNCLAEPPTLSIEHLYYLSSRADYVRRLKADDMIEYCIAQKIGGRAFDDLYAEVVNRKLQLAKMLKVEDVPANDKSVIELNQMLDQCVEMLRAEAMKIQNGIYGEGLVARDALSAVGRNALGAAGKKEQ